MLFKKIYFQYLYKTQDIVHSEEVAQHTENKKITMVRAVTNPGEDQNDCGKELT